MLAGCPDAFRANSTSSQRRLTRVVSPRPVIGSRAPDGDEVVGRREVCRAGNGDAAEDDSRPSEPVVETKNGGGLAAAGRGRVSAFEARRSSRLPPRWAREARARGACCEAEYHALIRGLKLAAEKRLPHVAAFSDSANVVNQITRGWNKNERASELYEAVEEALKPFKRWQLSWVPREMNREADKLVDQVFKGDPVIHATD
jgi:ribonuclease HI